MKNFLLAFNILLLIGLGILYYEFYEYKNKDVHVKDTTNAAVSKNFTIAYFELDSLQENYSYFKEVRTYLNSQEAQMTKQLNALRDGYFAKLKEYNQKGPTMSQTEQGAFEQQLMKMKNDLEQKNQDLTQEMNNLALRRMQDVKIKIQDFLKVYSKEKGYSFVFAATNEDYIYYKDTLRNVTDDIVSKLNEAYKPVKKP